jgi:hypothetical protein
MSRVLVLALLGLAGCGDVVLGDYAADGDETSVTPEAMAIIVGDNRLRARSVDGGQSWEPGQSEAPDTELRLYGIEYADGQFVAVGGESLSRIERSFDGVEWELVHSGQGLGLRDVVHTGSRWIAVGMGGEVLRSDDAMSWESQIVPIVNTKLTAVASDGDQLLLAVGDGDVVASFNGGDEWLPKFDDGLSHVAVAYGGDFVVADLDGTVHVMAENLATWTDSNQVAPSLGDLVFAEGRYLALGAGNILEATDPTLWETHVLEEAMERIDYRDGIYLGIGGDGRFHSDTGLSWTRVASAEVGRRVAIGD